MGDCVLLTGAGGYVGRRLRERLSPPHDLVGVGRGAHVDVQCDLADAAAVGALAREITPRFIVHAAGNKNLSTCERDPAVALSANVETTMNVLRAWSGVPMVYVSTDYVFSGQEGGYTEESPAAPATVYGQSKLCAEMLGRLLAPGAFTTVRVSALYDESATFLDFLFTELSANRPVDCFLDAYYSPTYVEDFAAIVGALIDGAARPDALHVAGTRTSRYEFARLFASTFGFDPDLVRPVHLDVRHASLFPDLSLGTRIARDRLGFVPTPHRRALHRIAEERLCKS